MTPKLKLRYWLIIVLALAALGVFFILSANRNAVTAEVRGVSYSIKAPFAGFAGEIFVAPGQRVVLGENLFTMETEKISTRLADHTSLLAEVGSALPYAVRKQALAQFGLADDQSLLPDPDKQLNALRERETGAQEAARAASVAHSKALLEFNRLKQAPGADQAALAKAEKMKKDSEGELAAALDMLEKNSLKRSSYEMENNYKQQMLQANPASYEKAVSLFIEEAAQIKTLRAELDEALVKAPFSAYAISVNAVKGAKLDAGQPVFSIDPSDKKMLQLEAVINTKEWPSIKPGVKCEIKLPSSGSVLPGVVAALEDENAERAIAVIHFTDDGIEAPELRPGLTVKVSF